LLTEEEVLKLCNISKEEEVDFVKTSTGINAPGASVQIVRFLRENLPSEIKIKASGGIRERQFAEELIAAGADRLGSSAGVAIVGGLVITGT
jgi:deoxyribose-phosphate aldolase